MNLQNSYYKNPNYGGRSCRAKIRYCKWTTEEDNWLKNNYLNKTAKECAEYLKVSEMVVRNRFTTLDLPRKNIRWSEKEKQLLIEKYPYLGAKECIKYFKNRNKSSIINMAHTLNLKLRRNTYLKIQLELNARCNAKWKDPKNAKEFEKYKQHLSNTTHAAHKEGYFKKINKNKCYKGGRRKDLNNKSFRSAWEANYARYLNLLIKDKKIFKWEYETERFIFNEIKSGYRSYLPDFKIWETEKSEPYYHEVKGWMDHRSETKLKYMEKYYPLVKIILIREKEYKEIETKFKTFISNWE